MHVFAICVKTGIIFKMKTTHVIFSCMDTKHLRHKFNQLIRFLKVILKVFCYSSTALAGGYSCVTLTLTLKVILKVLLFNITQRFTNSVVQLSIFLIDLCFRTYKLSSHARLEAFVTQTKLKKVASNLHVHPVKYAAYIVHFL
jgi:hypothetical protein